MARVLHSQDEDPDVGILPQTPDLLLKQIGRAEIQFALDVDYRNLRIGARGGIPQFGELTAFVEGIFHEGRRAGFLQKQHQRRADAHVDGGLQLEEERGAQGDREHHGIGPRRAQGHPDLRFVDQAEAHAHQMGREGGHRDVIENRRDEE